MKWRPQKFTFMVIPDANSQVVRFQLSALILLSALVLLVVVAAAAAIALILYGNRADEVGRLKHQLSASAGQFEKIITEKERHIGDLETEVAGLSDQAKSIQNKMADINVLESQLKKIAGIETKGGPASAQNAADAGGGQDAGYAMDGGAAGGEDLPVTEDAMDSLLEETHSDFSSLSELIEEMKPRLEETKDAVLQRQAKLRATPTIWPTVSRKITSIFGVRRDPFTHQARFHAGLDISGDTGDPVYAAADGTVIHADQDGAHGLNVELSHGNGITTHYSHLSKIIAVPGKKVKKGELIGLMGSTGRSTGPHLHYEVAVKGTHVDPKPYLQADRKEP
jgi:murein DD-endopeptidase MepM/ murein hydrolase activator NlpD